MRLYTLPLYQLENIPKSIVAMSKNRQGMLSLIDPFMVGVIAKAVQDTSAATDAVRLKEEHRKIIFAGILETVMLAVVVKKSLPNLKVDSLSEEECHNYKDHPMMKHIITYLNLENENIGLAKKDLSRFLSESSVKDNFTQNDLERVSWINELADRYLLEQKDLSVSINENLRENFKNEKAIQTLSYLIDCYIETISQSISSIEDELKKIKSFFSGYCKYFGIEININLELACFMKLLTVAIAEFKSQTDFSVAKSHAELTSSPKSSSPVFFGIVAAFQMVSSDAKKFIETVEDYLPRITSEETLKRFLRTISFDKVDSDDRLKNIFIKYKIFDSNGVLNPVFSNAIKTSSPELVGSPLGIYSPRVRTSFASGADSLQRMSDRNFESFASLSSPL